jgi:hypothetical protein
MNSVSEDIKDILEAESSLDLTFGTNLFVAHEPATPANTVTVYDTAGYAPQLTMDKDEIYEYPSVQIRVRNVSYQTGWELINDIKRSLHGRAHETWNGTYYSVIRCSSDIALVDWDNSKRARFVVNFDIQRR